MSSLCLGARSSTSSTTRRSPMPCAMSMASCTCYFRVELDDRYLTPGDDARIVPTRFEDWRSQSAK